MQQLPLLAEEQLRLYQAGGAILSVDGVSAKGGVTSFHAEETTIARMMIQRAKRVIIAADDTKISRTGFTHICDIGPEVKLVTDLKCSREAVQELETLGMQIELA